MILRKFTSEEEYNKETISLIKEFVNLDSETSIALSGGSTPKTIYQLLSREDLPFKDIEFYQVDERYVPKTNESSNYKMIFENLVQPIENQLGAFHYFDTSLPIEEALEKYTKELPGKGFDLCILGMGEDGHIASLFPGSPALESTEAVAHTKTSQQDRLTLTFPTIMASKKVLLLLKGKGKKPILADLQKSPKPVKELPAKKLLTHPNLTIHFCDLYTC